jgi:protein O-mannosyl-transferase
VARLEPGSEAAPDHGIADRTLLIVVLALTAVAYVATLQFEFVYDDKAQIVGNQLIEHWRFVPYYFHMQVWAHINPHQAGNYYRPVFMIWMRVNQALFGDHPFGWHLTTVLMHVFATFFVYKLARRLSAREDVSLITALIFGLHPAHVEAVAWVSGVTEALFAILLISSFLWFLDWREGRRNARAYSLLLFALAIFSKETAVLMMPLVFVYEWVYPRESDASLRRRFWTALRPAVPYLAITCGYLYVRGLALNGLFHPVTPLDRTTILLTIPSVLWFYVKLLFVPIGLSAFYDTPYVRSANLHQFWLPLFGVMAFALVLFAWWWKTRDRLVAFASALLVLPLLPLMNFSVFFTGEIAHDRYLYIPSIGFALLIALALVRVRRIWRNGVTSGALRFSGGVAITCGITLVLLVLTISQSLYWANNLVLYNRGVQIAPGNNLALNNFANELEERHMYPQAITAYKEVLSRNPNFYLSNYNLGYVLYEDGQWKQAAYFLRRAATLDPTDAETFYHLAQCEMQLDQLVLAEADLHRAIATDPRLLGPRYTLGLLLKQQGRDKDALDWFRAELSKNPNDADARKQVTELSGQ